LLNYQNLRKSVLNIKCHSLLSTTFVRILSTPVDTESNTRWCV